MKLKVLALGSGILVLLALAAYGVNRWAGGPGDRGRVGQPVMQGVDVARAARVEIVGPEHAITLKTADDGTWTVAQQQDFPVNVEKIKNLFLTLSTEKVAHEVTRRKDKLAELGLLTPEENGGKAEAHKTGTQIRVLDADGKALFSVIVGNNRKGGPTSSGGAYLRYDGEPAAYLVAKSPVPSVRPEDWINTVVLDEDANKVVRSVRVERDGKRPVVLTRDKPEGGWTLQGMPAAQLSKEEVARITTQLAGLDVFGVKPGNADPAKMGRARLGHVHFTFFDGRGFTADVGEAKADDNFRYITLRADLDPAVKDEALKEKVQRFNQRFHGRLLAVYDWDGKAMIPAWDEFRAKKDGPGKK